MKQLKFIGYDEKLIEKFYKNEYLKALKRGFSEKQAHEHAKFMVEFYGHQFRKYI